MGPAASGKFSCGGCLLECWTALSHVIILRVVLSFCHTVRVVHLEASQTVSASPS